MQEHIPGHYAVTLYDGCPQWKIVCHDEHRTYYPHQGDMIAAELNRLRKELDGLHFRYAWKCAADALPPQYVTVLCITSERNFLLAMHNGREWATICIGEDGELCVSGLTAHVVEWVEIPEYSSFVLINTGNADN